MLVWWVLGVVLVTVWVVWFSQCLGQWAFRCWFGSMFGQIDGGGWLVRFW